MKLKRLTATMLALLLVVSLLPMAAMADNLPDNSVDQELINQPIGTNSGTGVGIDPSGRVQTNTGTVRENQGTVVDNNGRVAGNMDGGKVVNNNAGATVWYNNAGATVENNKVNATVNENYGFVGKKDGNGNLIVGGSSGNSGNSGTVENNNAGGTVNNISGTVVNNNADGIVYNISGTVVNNNASGIVNNNGGTVQNSNAGGVVNNYGGTVVNNNAYGTVNHNGGTVENNSGDVSNEGGTVEKNEFGGNVVLNIGGTVENNYGLVGKKDENGNLITDGSSGNSGTVENNQKGGIVTNNTGTVMNNMPGGIVVNNNAGGVVHNHGGTVVNNNAGGTVHNNGGEVGSNSGTVYNNTEGSVVKVNEVDGYVANNSLGPDADGPKVEINFGTVRYAAPSDKDQPIYYGVHYEDEGKNKVYIDQFIKNTPVSISDLNISRPGYKLVNCQAVEEYENSFVDVTDDDDLTKKNDDGSVRSFFILAPTRLKLFWEKIVTAVTPAPTNEPEAKTVKKTVPTSLSGDQLKVGAYVRRGNMTFVIIEVTDNDIRVATAGKLSEQDLADMLGCLKKHLSDAQIAKLIGEPELLEQELVNYFFGGRNEHIAFRAARDLFA